MKLILFVLLVIIPFGTYSAEKRCGWLENPTPANLWLTDKDGEWILSTQGGYSVDDDSMDNIPWPSENMDEYVRTNNNYGFSCACLIVETDKQKRVVLRVISGEHLLLKNCLEDNKLIKKIPLRSE